MQRRGFRTRRALLPTFVAAGVTELNRILPDQISVRREVWMSVRTEQNHLVKIKQVSKFLKRIFESDVDFPAWVKPISFLADMFSGGQALRPGSDHALRGRPPFILISKVSSVYPVGNESKPKVE